MAARADGRISVMPGCGLTPENVASVVKKTSANEVHAACNAPVPGPAAFSDFDPPGGRFETSASEVRRMVTALSSH